VYFQSIVVWFDETRILQLIYITGVVAALEPRETSPNQPKYIEAAI
jgi:hypothetical protein